jgi:hypothetical protein
MFYDLLTMDLSNFDIRAVPHTAAKAQQQTLGLSGTEAWLHQILQEGAIGFTHWQDDGLTMSTEQAYDAYKDFSKEQHAFRPDDKSVWSKKTRKVLGICVRPTRQTQGNLRIRSFKFAPLAVCRHRFTEHLGAPNIEWEPESDAPENTEDKGAAIGSIAPPQIEWAPDDTELEDVEWEPVED